MRQIEMWFSVLVRKDIRRDSVTSLKPGRIEAVAHLKQRGYFKPRNCRNLIQHACEIQLDDRVPYREADRKIRRFRVRGQIMLA